jgi:hypothetical protein
MPATVVQKSRGFQNQITNAAPLIFLPSEVHVQHVLPTFIKPP